MDEVCIKQDSVMTRRVSFKVIGKTTERGFFGVKYYLAIKLTDTEVFGESAGRTSTIRVTFDQYCDCNVDNDLSVTMESTDGSYWRFT